MTRYYKKYNPEKKSWSVFERDRLNEFGEEYCVLPLVTEKEADNYIRIIDQEKTHHQTKFRPGPYKIIYSEEHPDVIVAVVDAEGLQVADVNNPAFDRKVEEANARLFKEAPAMLKALKAVIEEYDKAGGMMAQAIPGVRTVIAEIEGKV